MKIIIYISIVALIGYIIKKRIDRMMYQYILFYAPFDARPYDVRIQERKVLAKALANNVLFRDGYSHE